MLILRFWAAIGKCQLESQKTTKNHNKFIKSRILLISLGNSKSFELTVEFRLYLHDTEKYEITVFISIWHCYPCLWSCKERDGYISILDSCHQRLTIHKLLLLPSTMKTLLAGLYHTKHVSELQNKTICVKSRNLTVCLLSSVLSTVGMKW